MSSGRDASSRSRTILALRLVFCTLSRRPSPVAKKCSRALSLNDRITPQCKPTPYNCQKLPYASGGDAIAAAAAANFRSLRRRGIPVRKTIDPLIGTWCIENRRPLLHNDSDFQPMARHLGLVEVPATA